MRCSTKQGRFQCDKEEGHEGECETRDGPRSTQIRAAQDQKLRDELKRAADDFHRIASAIVVRRFQLQATWKDLPSDVKAPIAEKALSDEKIEALAGDAFERIVTSLR